MTRPHDHIGPQLCVGIVCCRQKNVLMIKRAKAPGAGSWSIPGGKVGFGEGLIEAAHRELFEETGLTGKNIGLIEVYELLSEGFHYVVLDYLFIADEAEPQAGDDALEAKFVPIDIAIECAPTEALKKLLQKVASHMPLSLDAPLDDFSFMKNTIL